ncbi:hypothetical protein DVH24_009525 [Malus domestica]|uniref:Uncharacterized protein n=1 Tax=Malus domestica TaxID=3750 RepID=A0A498IU45_MALDO|nr:hypothetical protein DVH24_009525 [Malus domestica]
MRIFERLDEKKTVKVVWTCEYALVRRCDNEVEAQRKGVDEDLERDSKKIHRVLGANGKFSAKPRTVTF